MGPVEKLFRKGINHWHQGEYKHPTRPECYCLDGAILGNYTNWQPIREKVIRIIKKLFPSRKCKNPATNLIAHFNDHPSTTLDDVVKVVTEAGI
jgi:hypothetical protein